MRVASPCAVHPTLPDAFPTVPVTHSGAAWKSDTFKPRRMAWEVNYYYMVKSWVEDVRRV